MTARHHFCEYLLGAPWHIAVFLSVCFIHFWRSHK